MYSTTGDLDAFEYGGGIFYSLDHKFYWDFWPQRDPSEKNFTIYTTYIPNNVLNYYGKKLSEELGIQSERKMIEELSMIGDADKQLIRKLSRSKNPMDRLSLVMILRDTFGPSFVATENQYITPWELCAKWGALIGKTEDDVPMLDYEDYIVRVARNGDYACGKTDGNLLGVWPKMADCLRAIKIDMERLGDMSANVFWENEPMDLELIDWDISDAEGQPPDIRAKISDVFWRRAMRVYDNEIESKRKQKKKEVIKTRKQIANKLETKRRFKKLKQALS